MSIFILLTQKIETKDIQMQLNISLSPIEKRKGHIKNALLKDKGRSNEKVEEAKRIGLF